MARRDLSTMSRVMQLKLDAETLALIDAEYDRMAQEADAEVIEKNENVISGSRRCSGNDTTIDSLVQDILEHYESYRADLLTGKAMIVAYSRAIAMKIYERILALRPSWTEKVAVVMTGNKDL